MDSSTHVEIPRAISEVKATDAIERTQGVWNYRVNIAINVINQAKMEYERAASDAIGSVDNSHERAYELGEVVDPAFKLGQRGRNHFVK